MSEVMERINRHTNELFSKTNSSMEAFFKAHQEHLDALARYFAEKK